MEGDPDTADMRCRTAERKVTRDWGDVLRRHGIYLESKIVYAVQ